ncbi:MAG: hypothetical protein RL518_938 [Pseudomonadota bacterium]|jgi:predicted RNA-binding protein YlxR (DUF448 family)
MGARLRTIERTCCICRSKGDKRTLIRLVAQGSALVFDEHQRLPGRGGYVHATIECLSKMGQAQRWERALRLKGASLEASQVSRVVMELMTRVKGSVAQSDDRGAGRGSAKKIRL